MTLILRIENVDSLPDGGPLSVEIDRRGIDIGRDQHLDWTLPDPQCFISGKHCEIRYDNSGYWLHDLSTNGTFLNGTDRRLKEPYRLKNGDRLMIGHYIVNATITGESAEEREDDPGAPQDYSKDDYGKEADFWGVDDGDIARPIDRANWRSSPSSGSQGAVSSDFLEAAFDAPQYTAPATTRPTNGSPPDLDWTEAAIEDTPENPRRITPLTSEHRSADSDNGYVGHDGVTSREEIDLPEATTDERPDIPAQPALSPAGTNEDIMGRLAKGAGLSPDVFAHRDAGDVAEEIGVFIRLICENLSLMLTARAEIKGVMRSTRQTMIEAVENNPLKFSDSPQDAMRIMFGPKTESYLDARKTVEESFDNLKRHQLHTFTSMQLALKALFEDLSPDAIIGADRKANGGIGALLSSRKAKLWETYEERWRAKAGDHDRGLIDAFMILFSEIYDRQSREG